MIYKLRLPLTILCFSLLFSGCSSSQLTDLFSSYYQQVRDAKHAQQQGNFNQALKLLPEKSEFDASYNLYLLEQGRLHYLVNQYQKSENAFEHAYQLVQEENNKAKIQLSKGVENAKAIMSNDNATRYDVPAYEQSMLHSYQSLNYLYQQNLSAALVEVRRANLVQESALNDNKNVLYQYQQQLLQQGVSEQNWTNNLPSMDNTIGEIKNGFQNAFTFYLSALLYEAAGQSNDAYIDYKKALEIAPENQFIQHDVWRLANQLNMLNDITLMKERFSIESLTEANYTSAETGQVVLIFEQGIVKSKSEYSLNLPIYTSHNDMRFYSVAIPSYANYLTEYSPARVSFQEESFYAQDLVRLQSLAAKQLKEDMPMIVSRQIARLITKEEIRQQLSRKNGDIGNILASLYNIATEHADTRSWSTLPDSISICQFSLPKGQQTLTVNINGIVKEISVLVNENRKTLITMSAIGQNTDYQSINL
ncbi:COG3014 family protein [Colwellia sp. RSH04]|uniref:COG3014 family protein n=1 Tax=Colwellia sp. RSH04 TaxID=2305464 RepID=UPI000E580279|nr:hypothetical protein [Colwellia sp. RSH04]RHW76790.1 hypothetical protein D1094_06820 [Colwellia sp. RSH04]